ncbi:transglutaminase-like domain-containing protein [Nocardia sp. NPDC051570]|uniref:transglutaminase-like domain-containing protein n=1 Tax=Nocardia sp. NPDC051570 TaxID=3364324 RepID=UPI00379F2603
MTETVSTFYTSQSRFTDPRAMSRWFDGVRPDLPAIHAAVAGLVFHYAAHGDITSHGFAADRIREIDSRYADVLLERLHELNPGPLDGAREQTDRVVGCCRDATLLFVALARHHGIPARARIGFAMYLTQGWALDHVVAEVWDRAESRWRLVDAEFAEHDEIDVLDVPRDMFLTGPQAWEQCRAGVLDPDRFVVSPNRPEPFLRSWPQLTHNLVQDLAALNKHEMILWDVWGLLDDETVDTQELAPKLDALAELLQSADLALDQIEGVFADAALRVPETVTTISPAALEPIRITLRAS